MNNSTTLPAIPKAIALSNDLGESCPVCGDKRYSKHLEAPDRFHLRTDVYRLLKCSSCACIWLAHPPRPDEMGLHYTDDYHKGIAAAGEGCAMSRWRNQGMLISQYMSGGKILVVGCSSGAFLDTMKGPSWQLFGIEMEESTAERARSKT